MGHVHFLLDEMGLDEMAEWVGPSSSNPILSNTHFVYSHFV